MLGNIRGKYGSIPIPGAQMTLDGDTLRGQAQQMKATLITQLNQYLQTISRSAMLQKKQQEAEQLQTILSKVPTKIYLF